MISEARGMVYVAFTYSKRVFQLLKDALDYEEVEAMFNEVYRNGETII